MWLLLLICAYGWQEVRTLLGVPNCVIASCQNGTSANCAFFPAMHLQCGSLVHPNIATLTPLTTSTERPQTDCHFSPCLLHMATCLTIITPSAFAVRRHHATFEAPKPMLPTRKSPVYFRDMLIYPSWYVSVPSVPYLLRALCISPRITYFVTRIFILGS
jgi:hypothetical protein